MSMLRDDQQDQTNHITVSKLLKESGYQTAIVGKWHLGHGAESDPSGMKQYRPQSLRASKAIISGSYNCTQVLR